MVQSIGIGGIGKFWYRSKPKFENSLKPALNGLKKLHSNKRLSWIIYGFSMKMGKCFVKMSINKNLNYCQSATRLLCFWSCYICITQKN